MALALADALLEAEGEVVPELIARNVIRWVDGFDAFNKNILGPSSQLALSERKRARRSPSWKTTASPTVRRCAFRLWAACCLPRRWRISTGRCGWPPARRTNPTSPSPVQWRSRGPSRGRWRGTMGLDSLALPEVAGMPSAGRNDVQPFAGGAHRTGVSGGG